MKYNGQILILYLFTIITTFRRIANLYLYVIKKEKNIGFVHNFPKL